jgi:hypothetical protein
MHSNANSTASLLKKGATKPPVDYNPMDNFLKQNVNSPGAGAAGSQLRKQGVGHTVMGGKFKSVYLAQGKNLNN